MRVQARRRVAFIAALMVMVGAGRWLLLDASVPQVAAGTWATSGGFGPIPDGAAAATLADGRMVIAGGRYDNGALVSQIGIFDPASQSWVDGGQLAMARTGHTASALSDGRVLFAGGITANGVTSDVEVFDPSTGQSVHSGDMWSPRVNHAAAALGMVVFIAGGSDGLSVLDHVELFYAEVGLTESQAVRMSAPRKNFTATTLLDGHVLIAGGRNDSGDLATAEIFESGSRSIFPTGSLHSARSGHVAVLLPNNNQVLIAGGNGASAEVYADWRDGFTVVPNPMTQARTGAVGGALPLHDLAFVGGGGSPTGEYFGYATVKTDRADYWPGETVTITGSGWQPGERVALKISEDSDTHHDFTYTAVANGQGQIENTEFAPIENEVFHHFGKRFYLTATGVASTALNTFTDGNANVTGVVTSSVNGSPISGATVTCITGCNSAATTTTLANGSYTLAVQYPGSTASIMVTASAAGYATESEAVSVSNSAGGSKNFSLDPAISVTTSGSPSIYGDSVTFTATITSSATGSVQFKDGATNLGGPVAVSGGQATLVTSALLTGSHSITAVFTGTPANSTSAALVQVVDLKALTITATNQSKVYGNVMTPTGTEFTAPGLIGTDAVTSVTLSSPGYALTATVAGSPHTITPSAAVGSGLSNYSITYATGVLTVTARPVTVTADAKTKTYGAMDPAFTHQVTLGSLVGSDGFSGALTRVAGESVGTYAIEQGTLTLGTNYAITFVSADLSITPATLTVAAQPQTKQYGIGDPLLTFLTTGLQFTDTAASVLSGSLVRVPGENVAGSPYAITQGSLVANSNYTIAFTASMLSITPATLTVTAEAKTKPYGDDDPALTYASSGYKFSDSAASVLTGALQRATGENVAGSPYAIGQGTLAANSNYTIAFAGASLTITPATLTVTADAKNKEYGAVDPPLTYVSSGYKFTDSASVLSGLLERAPGETVVGGPYAIGQGSLAANANYTISFNAAALTINPKAASVTPAAASKEYGASDPVFAGSLVGFLAADSVTATYSRTAGETVAGGPYTISATLSPAGVLSNYAITSNTANFTINPKGASVTPAAASKEYGASDPVFTGSLVGFVAADNVTATYSRAAGETVAGGPYTISGTLSPAGVLGNYTITYNTANFTIDPKTASVSPAAASKEYGSSDPAFTGSLVGFLAADGVTATYSRTAGETVAGGPYTISATLSPAAVLGNYAITSNTANFTIDPKAASVTPAAASKEYGAGDPALTGSLSGFLAGDNVTASYTRAAGETVAGGPYTISATLSPAAVLGNYTITSNTANFTIDPKAASVTPAAASKEYGASDPALTGALVGFLGADSVTATYNRAAGETVTGGPYTISATLSPAAVLTNYAITYNTAAFTINPKGASVTPAAASKEYGASDPTLTGSLSGFLASDAVTASYSRVAGETVLGGPYTISATLSPVGVLSNYNVTYNTANFTITTKSASVTPAAASKQYGESDPTLTGNLVGFLGADGVTATYNRAAGETVTGGPYTISATLSPAGVLSNYNVTYNTANFTITTKAASVSPAAASKQYGESDPTLTGILSGFLASDAVTASYSRVAGETVLGGPYTISATLSPAGVLSNYNVTYITANFTITTKAASVTPAVASKQYGASDPALTGSLSGFLAADNVTASYSRVAGETVLGGPYAISATLSPAGVLSNYNVTYNTANFTITTKSVSVTPAAASKEYGASDPTLTGSLSGFLASDAVTASYSRVAGETVLGGPYTISATLSPAGVLSNYNLTYNTAAFTITPKPASVTAADKSKTYGDPNPVLTATVTGTVNGDTLSYALATTATQNSGVGGYPITVTPGLNPNYNVTPVSGTLTVTPATLTVSADAKVKIQGTADPAFTYGVSGLRNGDTTAVVTGTLSRDPGEAVGKYPVRKGTLTVNSNYSLNYVGEDLTIVYSWSDVLQPINKDGSSIFKLGSTIPVKFQLTGASASTSSLVAHIYIAKVSNGVAGIEVEPSTNVNADAGNVFRYDATANQYIFNWGTKGLSEGTWQIRIDLGDGQTHVVNVSLRK